MTTQLKKAELHCHLEGAAPPALTLDQARKYGVDPATFMDGDRYAWTDFSEFIKAYDKVAGLFRTEDDYALLTETYLRELASVGTIYSELIISPDHVIASASVRTITWPALQPALSKQRRTPVSRCAFSSRANAISVRKA